MGRVYLAHDSLLQRDIALKELVAPQYITGQERVELRERFRREALAAARLTHPHIVTVHDIIVMDDRQFMVMEYLAGKTLRQILKERIFSPEELLSIAPMMTDALAYAHDQGIIHRDIKPDNIFVLETGNIKVADFGIAKMLKLSDKDRTGVIMGTPNYIAPELVKGMAYDHRIDIFSLGVTLYELLTGRRPFDGDNEYAIIYRIGSEEPAPLSLIRPDIPDGLARSIHHALQKDPEARYPNMKALKEDLMDLRANLGMNTAREESRFDKEKALKSELEKAKELDDHQLNGDDNGGSDFERDKEWRQLIAQIYHKAPDEADIALSPSKRSSWDELEAMARGERVPRHSPEAGALIAGMARGRSGPRPSVVQTAPNPGAPALPGGTVTLDRTSQLIDPVGSLRWSAICIAAGLLVIISMMLPWIGVLLNPTRSLYGITFPEGVTVTILTILVLCADGLLLLGIGKPATWTRVMKDLALISLFMVLLFIGLRVFWGIGYDKATGIGAMEYLKGIGWGLWMALAGSLLGYVAAIKVGKAAI